MTRKRIKRSEPLTPEEHEAFRSYYQTFHTKLDAAEHIGLTRQILDGVFYKGSGSGETIRIIRRKLTAAAKERA